MTNPTPADGRATLVRSYRNMSEREIRRRLQGPLSEAERVTARAELLRREDNGPDTTFVTGFAPTGAFDLESEADLAALAEQDGAAAGRGHGWLWAGAGLVVVSGALAWAWRTGLLHR